MAELRAQRCKQEWKQLLVQRGHAQKSVVKVVVHQLLGPEPGGKSEYIDWLRRL